MLPKNLAKVIVVFALHVILVYCYSGSSILSKPSSKNRQGRILSLITNPDLNLYFEYNSCYALAAVVSVPLELPTSRSVFFSYNFETNYCYSYFDNQQGLTPVPFTYIDENGPNGVYDQPYLPPGYRQLNGDAELIDEETNTTAEISDAKLRKVTNGIVLQNINTKEEKESLTEKKQKKDEKSKARKVRTIFQNYLMSRRRFYKMVESKMQSSNLNGRDCLLKAICEASADSFSEHNGVLGSIFDILFLPSTSKDEKLPKRYYQAEANGKLHKCNVYDKSCPKSIFDFITKIL